MRRLLGEGGREGGRETGREGGGEGGEEGGRVGVMEQLEKSEEKLPEDTFIFTNATTFSKMYHLHRASNVPFDRLYNRSNT